MMTPATSITRVHESARPQQGTVTASLPPGGAVAGPAIETHGLTKRYGARTAVDGLDIEVPRGVIAGFVGPNGAGKTTTLRMLLGLIRPTAGTGWVLGVPLTSSAGYLGQVGALIESPAFYPGLSGQCNLAVQATLAGIDPARIPAVLQRVGLDGRGSDLYKTYSLGMKQRLGIAAALLGEPSLLILDEPANGLDPAGIREMRDLLRSLNADGGTVFVSSHQLGEVQQVCDWLVVIDQGRLLFQGPTGQLMAGRGDVLVTGCQPAADLPRLGAILARRGLPCTRTGDRLYADLAGIADIDEMVAEISQTASAEKLTLIELTVTQANLEDRYLNLIPGGPLS
jgi:ABC-2 type transport system ATP-binding protein